MSAAPQAVGALGPPIQGPAAVSGDPRRFFYLAWTLAVTEFKLKFFGSMLGYLWQLMRPLLLFGVLYVVFTEFVRLGGGVDHYPVVLLTGIVFYTFFAEATGMSVTSVVDREDLVRKVQFPRLVIPLSVVLTAFFNLMLNLVAILVFIAASGVEVRLTWLELPVLLVMLAGLATGVAMIVSALFVRFRDVKPIWEVSLQIIFYASPILYPIEVIPSERIQEALMLSPLGAILQQTRHALIDPNAPGAVAVAGGWEWMLIPSLLTVALFVVGYRVFRREAVRAAEEL